ncbi:hypothetical protein ACLB2K_057840 [Fragaria x ananassa]
MTPLRSTNGHVGRYVECNPLPMIIVGALLQGIRVKVVLLLLHHIMKISEMLHNRLLLDFVKFGHLERKGEAIFEFTENKNGKELQPMFKMASKKEPRGDLWVKFYNFKKQLSDNYDSNRSYETFITNKLSQLGVPKDEHLACLHTLFQAMEDVVNPEIPLLVSVFDATIIDIEDSLVPTRLNWIPASRSFIRALVQVTLDSDVIARSPSCAVCLDDFQQQVPITQLPCTHYFRWV